MILNNSDKEIYFGGILWCSKRWSVELSSMYQARTISVIFYFKIKQKSIVQQLRRQRSVVEKFAVIRSIRYIHMTTYSLIDWLQLVRDITFILLVCLDKTQLLRVLWLHLYHYSSLNYIYMFIVDFQKKYWLFYIN